MSHFNANGWSLKRVFRALYILLLLARSAHAQPVIVTQPVSQTNLVGSPVSFNVMVNGTGPFVYQWRFNGTNFPDIITTVAGNGTYAFAGDGGPATNASLAYPQGVAFDAFGNLFIADNDNERIRRVDPNGIITTVAGNGSGAHTYTGTYSGDGGAAATAGLNQPNNVAFDAAGNLYIADIFNDRIRRVDTNGIITTVAGNGAAASSHSGTYSGDGGMATKAGLFFPANAGFDASGNMFIADLYNYRIRKVDTNGLITTVAGDGVSSFGGDGGPATNASISFPQGVTVDPAGNVFIADTANACVRKVNATGIITTIAGSAHRTSPPGDGGAATNGSLANPWFVALDAIGQIYIADKGNNNIRKVDTRGIITTVAGGGSATYPSVGDGGPATKAVLSAPACVALDAQGDLYIADWDHNRVRKVTVSARSSAAFTNTFSLASAVLTNAGNYSVIVTSASGSVTSSIASLSLTIPSTPPQIIASGTNFGFSTNQFGFDLSGAPGQTIIVDGSTNLVTWNPLFTNTVVNSNAVYFYDPASTNFPWRFYRARLP